MLVITKRTYLYTILKFYIFIIVRITILQFLIFIYVTYIRKMIRASFIFLFAVLAICSYCGKDFKSLGRHSWRCKGKMNSNPGDNSTYGYKQFENSTANIESMSSTTSENPSNCSHIKCSCGKVCKGLRGLKMHQRSCRVISDLEGEVFESIEEDITGSYNNDDASGDDNTTNILPVIKPGIKLPKSDEHWKTANLHFMNSLPTSDLKSSCINTSIITMNETIYDYFHDNFGHSEDFVNDQIIEKYRDSSKRSLKTDLKYLKQSQAPISEIRYVARLLRQKISTSAVESMPEVDHDNKIQNNLWSYVKTYLHCSTSPLPSFSVENCTSSFREFFRSKNPSKCFSIPSWIPPLPKPSVPYNLTPPSYQQVTKVIRRMKASGSPCPLDKISIIPFKRCPYLKTYITEVIRILWTSGVIPDEWKQACTVLVHKKGDYSEPGNFRPITLESVPLKIFTSCVRDSLFSFLSSNNYLEHRIQKGFLPKLSGTFEHTAHMAYIIRKAKLKQKPLVITLLDLKNAFGEVHHNLIPEVLQYHHIPLHMQTIIRDLYSNFRTSIVTTLFRTPFIKVGRGVLQGDCLSPLTFNLCFILLSNIYLLQNLHSLASLLTFYIRSIGFNLLMTQLSLQASSVRIKCCYITLQDGVLGQI